MSTARGEELATSYPALADDAYQRIESLTQLGCSQITESPSTTKECYDQAIEIFKWVQQNCLNTSNDKLKYHKKHSETRILFGIAYCSVNDYPEAFNCFYDDDVILYICHNDQSLLYYVSWVLGKCLAMGSGKPAPGHTRETGLIYLREARDDALSRVWQDPGVWLHAANIAGDLVTADYILKVNEKDKNIFEDDVKTFNSILEEIDYSELTPEEIPTMANVDIQRIRTQIDYNPTHAQSHLDEFIQDCERLESFSFSQTNPFMNAHKTTYLDTKLACLQADLHSLRYVQKLNAHDYAQAMSDIKSAITYYHKAILSSKAGKKHNIERATAETYANCIRALSLVHPTIYMRNETDFQNIYEDLNNSFEPIKEFLIPNIVVSQNAFREEYWFDAQDIFTESMSRLSHLVYFGHENKGIHKLTYDAVLFSKGLLLKIGQEVNHAVEQSNEPKLIEMMKHRNELEKKNNLSAEELYEIDELNKELLWNVASNQTLLRKFDVRWEQVRDALGENDVAIEFLHFPAFQGNDTMMKMSWAALKLKKSFKSPEFIILGDLDSQLNIGDEEESKQDKLWYDSQIIDTEIWKPLLKEEISEGGKYRVFFAADGPLHNIAIENSPAMAHSENFELHRVASTRELVDGQRPLKLTDAVLFGNIAYDAPGDSVLAANRDLRQPQPSESSILSNEIFASINDMKTRGGRGSIYDYLSGTKAEIAHVEAALNSVGTACRTYDQARASEEAFKSLDGHSPTIIHLATHGYYVPPEKVESEREDMKLPFLEIGLGRSTAEDVALTHSFLTMADSRDMEEYNRREGVVHLEDGHLTAHEISRMDLHDTRLVVLSACESALGEVTNDGVLGLQRGFKRAGAGTIVMTVRKVGDAPAKDFMVTFYDELAERLKQNPNDPNALRNAFTTARNRVRHDYPNSLDWAYFIMLD